MLVAQQSFLSHMNHFEAAGREDDDDDSFARLLDLQMLSTEESESRDEIHLFEDIIRTTISLDRKEVSDLLREMAEIDSENQNHHGYRIHRRDDDDDNDGISVEDLMIDLLHASEEAARSDYLFDQEVQFTLLREDMTQSADLLELLIGSSAAGARAKAAETSSSDLRLLNELHECLGVIGSDDHLLRFSVDHIRATLPAPSASASSGRVCIDQQGDGDVAGCGVCDGEDDDDDDDDFRIINAEQTICNSGVDQRQQVWRQKQLYLVEQEEEVVDDFVRMPNNSSPVSHTVVHQQQPQQGREGSHPRRVNPLLKLLNFEMK